MRNCPKSVWLGEREDYPINLTQQGYGELTAAIENRHYQGRFGQPKKISAKM